MSGADRHPVKSSSGRRSSSGAVRCAGVARSRQFSRAYGYSHDGDHWLWLPGKAAFRFDTAGRQVEAIVPDGTSDRRVEELYQRHAMPFVLQARGRELLHASAALTPRGAIAFAGSSGAGKSTMAFALSQRGYPPPGR